MNISDVFPSTFLKASDIPPGKSDVVLTIQGVEMEQLGDDRKPVVQFRETEKTLVLNKTNAATISGLYGGETNAWNGKKISLFSTQVDFRGSPTMAIRVRLQAPEAYLEVPNDARPGRRPGVGSAPSTPPDPDTIPF
jgi:hypothetical protein